MKRFSYLFFLSLSVLFSCGDDEGGNGKNASGQISLDGSQKLNLDYAVLEGIISTGTHYSFTLSFFDKEINYDNLPNELKDVKVYLQFNLLSGCSQAVNFGEFKYVSPTDLLNGVPDEGYFTTGSLTTLQDNAPKLEQVNGGSITINREEGENAEVLTLTVSFDLEIGGKSLTGEYSGVVELVGSPEIDEQCGPGGGGGDGGDGGGGGGDQTPPSLGGDAFEINRGVIADVGSSETHYTYVFVLSSDLGFDLGQDGFSAGENYLVLPLSSLGTNDFRTGTFNYFDKYPLPSNQNYMAEVSVVKDYNPSSPEILIPISGSVVVERVNNDYTITFDLNLNNGAKLKGSYTEEFPIVDMKTNPPPIAVTNVFNWDGVVYEIVDLLIVDWGAVENHYNYDFFLRTKTNAEVDAGATNYHLVYLNALSWGTSSFSDGTFIMGAGIPSTDPATQEKDYIYAGWVGEVGNNPDAFVKENFMETGTVFISSQGTEYSIEFSVVVNDGEEISGRYSGGYSIVQAPEPTNPGGRLKNRNFITKQLSRIRP